MICEKPFVKAGKAFGCGQCFPCRFNRRRIWTHRIMLEAAQYTDNTFVTLTYDDENLRTQKNVRLSSPDDVASLHPAHLRNFLKRLRKALEPHKVRFYACGEYGDETWRPHYHLALFGFPGCLRLRTRRRPGGTRPQWESCCERCRIIGHAWGMGDVDLGQLETSSAQYIAGYVTKKMTSSDDPRLGARHPEFARMSNRPGIGHAAMHEVASQLMVYGLENREDVPGSLRHGARELPLGRYLTRTLRKMVGRDEKTPESVLQKYADEMSDVRESAFNNSQSFSSALVEKNKAKRAQFYARQKLKKKVKEL